MRAGRPLVPCHRRRSAAGDEHGDSAGPRSQLAPSLWQYDGAGERAPLRARHLDCSLRGGSRESCLRAVLFALRPQGAGDAVRGGEGLGRAPHGFLDGPKRPSLGHGRDRPGRGPLYVRNNPGSSGEQVAEEMGTDTATLRQALLEIAAGRSHVGQGVGIAAAGLGDPLRRQLAGNPELQETTKYPRSLAARSELLDSGADEVPDLVFNHGVCDLAVLPR